MLDERVFSLNFAGDHEISYITMGGYDVDEFAIEELTWHNNIGTYFWAVTLDAVSFVVDGEPVQEFSGRKFKTSAVIDSGSSYLLVPEKYFWAFYK